MGAVAALLPDGRLHLQHGPIDLLIMAEARADGPSHSAYRAARDRFRTMLDEIVSELPLLRKPLGMIPRGDIARRMHGACTAVAQGDFVTPMAAVAGAVADGVLSAMIAATPLARAYVNNGGDIALHLAPGADYRVAIAGLDGHMTGQIMLRAGDGIGGIAPSGQGGRSLSRVSPPRSRCWRATPPPQMPPPRSLPMRSICRAIPPSHGALRMTSFPTAILARAVS